MHIYYHICERFERGSVLPTGLSNSGDFAPPPEKCGGGIGQPEKVLFQNWKALPFKEILLTNSMVHVICYGGIK